MDTAFDPISTVDVSATILDLANADPPHRPDGASRLRTMLRGDQGWTTAVEVESATPGKLPHVDGFTDERTGIGIRTARYSLIINRREADELYDLAEDPLENRNVYRDRGHRAVRLQLLEAWAALRDCAGDACQTKLAAALQADPSTERRLTHRYWSAVDATYGWR